MFESLKLSFSEAHWIVITILGLYTWFINKQSASSKEMLDLRVRVVELENTVKDMPSMIEIARLEGQVETIKTQLNAANNSIGNVQKGVTRIENYLLDNKK
jgi:predicted  nucleic acid-binding Zn-ribbon protein